MDNILPSILEAPSKEGKDFQTSSKLFDDTHSTAAVNQRADSTFDSTSKTDAALNRNLLCFAAADKTEKPAASGAKAASAAAEQDITPRTGIIPPYVLEDLARLNPNNRSFNDTLIEMRGHSFWPFPPKPKHDHESYREVYDAQGKTTHPGKKARFEGDKATGNNEVDKAYDFTGEVRSFYKDLYNRNSIDDNGMKFISTVNYGQNYNNAFWNGSQMTYGKPGADSPFRTFMLLDVCGHEITHGVTEKEAHLQYSGQAGALNESLSDVFGELIKQHANHQTAKEGHWLVGEDIWKSSVHGRALRDMMNPGTAYDDPKVGKDPQPANMKDYVATTRDNGGVHINSGIPNKAFALFATSAGGNAWEEPGHIWYAARKEAGSNPSFAQFAYQTIEQAKKLGFEKDVPKLEKAWADVGVKPSATAGDTLTPARIKSQPKDAPEKEAPAPQESPRKEPLGWSPLYPTHIKDDLQAQKNKSAA